MAVIDTFFYNGERQILKLHLSMLDPFVDTFVICEAKKTFSGKDKPLYFFRDQHFFKPWWKKIEYFVIKDDFTPEEVELAETSPNTIGASHWKEEFLQKERIHSALVAVNAQDDDTIYVGDVDELWELQQASTPVKLKLKVYAYYLNNRSDEEFWGTLVSKYEHIKDTCLNHLRSDITIRGPDYQGWHFTSMGGLDEVKRKLGDSYTTESYNTEEVQNRLQERFSERRDYLGRPFQFTVDESEWPSYLKQHKKEYKDLCI